MVCLFLIASTVCVFCQVRNHDFVNYDDSEYVTENRHVQNGLTWEGTIWAFTTTHASNWHPLTWLSHMLDCQIYGLNPGGHHLTGLLFHIVNTLLLFVVLKQMTGALWQAAFVSALFALHPLHVESVAWVAERKDVVSAFFWLITMWAYVRYVKSPEFGRYLLVLLFFVLGLMAKPMLVTLPFALLLMDYWPLERLQLNSLSTLWGDRAGVRGALWEKVPLFALAAVSVVITLVAQQSGGAIASMDHLPMDVRMVNALVSYVNYIGKMIWPLKLAVFYPHPGILPIWQAVGAGLLLVWYIHSRDSGRPADSVSCRRVALVLWHTCAGHWLCAGGSPVYGRSLYIRASYRAVYNHCVGCCRPHSKVALSKTRACDMHRGSAFSLCDMHVVSGRPLAQQHCALQAHPPCDCQ